MRILLLVLFAVGACSTATQNSSTSLDSLTSRVAQSLEDRRLDSACQEQEPPPVRPVGFARVEMSEEELDALFDRYNSAQSVCLDEFMAVYQQRVYDYCEATCSGVGIGGGCAHIAGYSLHEGVLIAALESCGL